MSLESFKEYQSRVSSAAHQLVAEQSELAQQFWEHQRQLLSAPSSWTNPASYSKLQALGTKMVEAQQTFATKGIAATQTFFSAQTQNGVQVARTFGNSIKDVHNFFQFGMGEHKEDAKVV